MQSIYIPTAGPMHEEVVESYVDMRDLLNGPIDQVLRDNERGFEVIARSDGLFHDLVRNDRATALLRKSGLFTLIYGPILVVALDHQTGLSGKARAHVHSFQESSVQEAGR